MLGHVDRDLLLAALKRCSAVGGRGSEGSVRLAARGDELVVEASSLEAAVRTVVPLAAVGTGDAIVPLRVLERYVSSVSGPLRLEVERGSSAMLVVRSGPSQARLHLVASADAVGGRRDPHGGAAGALSAADLLRVRRVEHAASSSDTQPMLTGVCFEGGSVIASDGYRLATIELDASTPDCLVPADIVRRVTDEGAPVTMQADEWSVAFEATSFTYWTPPVAGAYFDWRRLVPPVAATAERFEADREGLLAATRTIEAMGLGAHDRWGSRVVIEPVGATAPSLLIRAADDLGDVVAEVEGALTMPKLQFNASFLRQSLEQLRGERVQARSEGPGRALVVEEDEYLELVMPVRG